MGEVRVNMREATSQLSAVVEEDLAPAILDGADPEINEMFYGRDDD